jgi:hypothetical protein
MIGGFLMKINGFNQLPDFITEAKVWVAVGLIAVVSTVLGVIGIIVLQNMCPI